MIILPCSISFGLLGRNVSSSEVIKDKLRKQPKKIDFASRIIPNFDSGIDENVVRIFTKQSDSRRLFGKDSGKEENMLKWKVKLIGGQMSAMHFGSQFQGGECIYMINVADGL